MKLNPNQIIGACVLIFFSHTKIYSKELNWKEVKSITLRGGTIKKGTSMKELNRIVCFPKPNSWNPKKYILSDEYTSTWKHLITYKVNNTEFTVELNESDSFHVRVYKIWTYVK